MLEVKNHLNAEVLIGQEHFSNPADHFIFGAMHIANFLKHIKPNVLIVTPWDRADIVMASFKDCAINIDPTAEELAEIAITSADSSQRFGIEPRVAMLSYSSGTSGSGEEVEKVRKATSIVREKRPDIKIEGPIQYDAAVDP